jgi:hypothetical protein
MNTITPRRVIVRYRVKPDQVEENVELVRAVYDELHRTQPDGIRYVTFQLDDGVSFLHFATETGEEPNPLPQLPAFQRFTRDIGERCDEPPAVTELREIGSFRL